MSDTISARLWALSDPRVTWRLLQTPLPEEEDAAAQAKALRSIARIVFFLGMGAVAMLGVFLVFLVLAFMDLGAIFGFVELLRVAAVVVAPLFGVTLAVRPFAVAYARHAEGPPLPRWALAVAGMSCILLALGGPTLFVVSLFMIHFSEPYPLLGSFLLTLGSPWLVLSGWRLLKP